MMDILEPLFYDISSTQEKNIIILNKNPSDRIQCVWSSLLKIMPFRLKIFVNYQIYLDRADKYYELVQSHTNETKVPIFLFSFCQNPQNLESKGSSNGLIKMIFTFPKKHTTNTMMILSQKTH